MRSKKVKESTFKKPKIKAKRSGTSSEFGMHSIVKFSINSKELLIILLTNVEEFLTKHGSSLKIQPCQDIVDKVVDKPIAWDSKTKCKCKIIDKIVDNHVVGSYNG